MHSWEIYFNFLIYFFFQTGFFAHLLDTLFFSLFSLVYSHRTRGEQTEIMHALNRQCCSSVSLLLHSIMDSVWHVPHLISKPVHCAFPLLRLGITFRSIFCNWWYEEGEGRGQLGRTSEPRGHEFWKCFWDSIQRNKAQSTQQGIYPTPMRFGSSPKSTQCLGGWEALWSFYHLSRTPRDKKISNLKDFSTIFPRDANPCLWSTSPQTGRH